MYLIKWPASVCVYIAVKLIQWLEICLSFGSSCFPIFTENTVHGCSNRFFERSWKWRARDFHAFLDAVNREIYLKHLVVLIKISIFVTRYRFLYHMEKNRDISPYQFIVPTQLYTFTFSHLASAFIQSDV